MEENRKENFEENMAGNDIDNRMEEKVAEVNKKAKDTFSLLGLCYIVGTAAVYALQYLLGLATSKSDMDIFQNLTVSLVLSCVITYGVGMPLIVLLARRLPARKPERHVMKWWQFVLALIMCYALLYISNILGTIVTTLIGMVKGSAVQNELVEYVTAGNLWVNFFLMVLVAPVVEEFVFRKVIVDRTIQYGEGIAILASGLMFGLFHGNLNQFAYAVGLGAFFAFLYVRTGNLKITIGMHAIVNFLGSVVASLLLNGLHYSELMELLEVNPDDVDALMELVMNNIGGWVLFFLYALCLFVVVVTGVILFIVFWKKFYLVPGENDVPKGQRFKTLIVNPGMLTFCAVWVVLIIAQLFT